MDPKAARRVAACSSRCFRLGTRIDRVRAPEQTRSPGANSSASDQQREALPSSSRRTDRVDLLSGTVWSRPVEPRRWLATPQGFLVQASSLLNLDRRLRWKRQAPSRQSTTRGAPPRRPAIRPQVPKTSRRRLERLRQRWLGWCQRRVTENQVMRRSEERQFKPSWFMGLLPSPRGRGAGGEGTARGNDAGQRLGARPPPQDLYAAAIEPRAPARRRVDSRGHDCMGFSPLSPCGRGGWG
jgi:hypothetical protein